ncbi:TRAP transporter small permease subunit [Desulfosarcina alkanivorans]|jgi:TRAP-type C4-dicarboxylate transport system permease small subunit|uniref:TRAP transporter small permease subunit n=1 Tax=Desulfosarcina alkanivorans TaxID=571177 RepID=UPI0012D2B872|nr:TRAP transporter small permease [Desulfosarcina alkanivorans]
MAASDTLDGVFQKISSAFTWLSRWVLLFMALIIFYDVGMRYLFNRPTFWAMEVSEYLLVYLAFAAAAGIQDRKSHIKMDYFHNKMSETARGYIDIIIYLGMVGFASAIIWTSARMTIIAYQYESSSNSTLEVPLWLPYGLVPLCMTLLVLQGAIDMAKAFKKGFFQ